MALALGKVSSGTESWRLDKTVRDIIPGGAMYIFLFLIGSERRGLIALMGLPTGGEAG